MAEYHKYAAGPDGQLDLLEKAREARDDAYEVYAEKRPEEAFALIRQAHDLTTRAELTDDFSQEALLRSRAAHHHTEGRLQFVEAVRTEDMLLERSALDSFRSSRQFFRFARRASGSHRFDQTEVHLWPNLAMLEAVDGSKREAWRFFGRTAVVGATLTSETRVYRHTDRQLSPKARLLEKAARIGKTLQVFDVLVSPRDRSRRRAAHYLMPRPSQVAKLVERKGD